LTITLDGWAVKVGGAVATKIRRLHACIFFHSKQTLLIYLIFKIVQSRHKAFIVVIIIIFCKGMDDKATKSK